MRGVSHYIHIRKRALTKAGTMRDSFKIRLLDRAAIVAGIVGPIMALPQFFKILTTQSATGVSALSWFAFAVLDIPFVLYGTVHRQKPIIFTYILWFLVNIAVGIAALAYNS